MWREDGCGGRVVDVKEGWMWREGGAILCGCGGGCGGRVDVKGGWWMWREGGGCEGRAVDVKGGW